MKPYSEPGGPGRCGRPGARAASLCRALSLYALPFALVAFLLSACGGGSMDQGAPANSGAPASPQRQDM